MKESIFVFTLKDAIGIAVFTAIMLVWAYFTVLEKIKKKIEDETKGRHIG
jgi:hypothetical protein